MPLLPSHSLDLNCFFNLINRIDGVVKRLKDDSPTTSYENSDFQPSY